MSLQCFGTVHFEFSFHFPEWHIQKVQGGDILNEPNWCHCSAPKWHIWDFPTVSQIQSISNARSGHHNYIQNAPSFAISLKCNCDARSGHLKWTEFGTLWENLGEIPNVPLQRTAVAPVRFIQNVPTPYFLNVPLGKVKGKLEMYCAETLQGH